VFAVISNFGVLARERTMVLPFVFVLLSVRSLAVNAPAEPAARPASTARPARSADIAGGRTARRSSPVPRTRRMG
jgi:hypothetical protein